MKLASRCTACGTLFSVVRDQLWVSGGRVRCGHCGTTFNAFDQLYDLQQGKPPPWQPDQPRSEAVPTTVATAAAAADHKAAALDEPVTAALEPTATGGDATTLRLDGNQVAASAAAEQRQDAETLRFDAPAGAPWDAAAAREPIPDLGAAGAGEQPPSPGGPPIERQADVTADVDSPATRRSESPLGVDALGGSTQPSFTSSAPASPGGTASPAAALEDATASAAGAPPRPGIAPPARPSFIRRAEQRARWSRPGVRIALGAATVVLAVTLLLQGAFHFRDRLSVHSAPAARVLAWWCARSGCTIGPPRRIADLTVESSVLTRVPGEGGLVRLALTVRNRGSVAAAVPALELSLTDASGKVVVRRAVRLSEMAGAPVVLTPQVDVPLQLLFATGGQRIAGFTAELFYP